MTLLLFLLVEGAFRLGFLVFPGEPETRRKADVYAGESWAEAYFAEFDASHAVDWKPYVYWRRRPFAGRYINVDGNGRRKTWQPAAAARVEPPFRIWMFGGSTLWGTGVRDEHTIPSLLARKLAAHGLRAEVVNFGESGYVTTQEWTTLALLLRAGARPDLAIFYDGVNDTFSAWQQGAAGIPQNEANRAREFNVSQPDELGRLLSLAARGGVRELAVVRAFGGLLRRRTTPLASVARPGSLPEDVVSVYRENVTLVRALADRYRFSTLFYWQPTLFDKPRRTAWEETRLELVREMESHFSETKTRATAPAGPSPIDLTDIFRSEAAPIFLDWCHTGERGNEIVATRMLEDVAKALGQRSPPER